MERTRKRQAPTVREPVTTGAVQPPVVENVPQPKQIEYIKTGRGSFRIGNRIIKQNERFMAYPHEVPAAFKDTVKPVQSLPPEPPLEIADAGYSKMEDGEKKGKFNVVDAHGKPLNETPLTEKEADELIKALSG